MSNITLHTLAIAVSLISSGCLGPGPNSHYYALNPGAAEANRRNTNRVEQEARDLNHEERMRQASAEELATRHAPTSVSTTNVYPFFW